MADIKIDSSGRSTAVRSENHDIISRLEAELRLKERELKTVNRKLNGVLDTLDVYAPRSLEYSGEIPGLEIAGRVIPHNGFSGGDLAIPLLFVSPEDRTNYQLSGSEHSVISGVEFLSKGPSEIGLFIADPPGHDPLDGVAAALVYQAARIGVKYELAMNGEVTSGLMKKLHDLFYPGYTSHKGVPLLGARLRVDGEVAKGSWQSAGHPTPRIFRLSELKFDSVDDNSLNMCTPIGYFPSNSEHNNYFPNQFVLNKGDVAFFYSDGVSDLGRKHGKRFFPQHAESVIRSCANMPLKDMTTIFGEDIAGYCDADDDMTYFLIRKT